MSKEYVENFYKRNYENECTNWIVQKWLMWKLFHIFEKFSIWRDKIAIEYIKKYRSDNIDNVLDIGASNWLFLMELSENIKWIKKFYWIDVNKASLKEAKQNCNRRWLESEFEICNIDEWMNFNDNTFDLITMLAVLEHTFDPIKVIEECARILKKWWWMVIEVPNLAVFFRRIQLLFGNRPRTSRDLWWDWWHLQYFTVKDLKNLLKNNGFEIKKVGWSWVFAKFRNRWPSLLSADIVIYAEKK